MEDQSPTMQLEGLPRSDTEIVAETNALMQVRQLCCVASMLCVAGPCAMAS